MVNWTNLDRKILSVELRHQHRTTATKFEIARYHLRKLKSRVPTQRVTDLIRLSYDERTNQMKVWAFNLPPVLEFLAEFDAFLYTLRSCVDSFLWEVNLVYDLKLRRISLTSVTRKMNRYCKNDELTKHLKSLPKAKWFECLGKVRNSITHRLCSAIVTSIDYKFYMPDDPSASTPSITKNLELFMILDELLQETKVFLETGFNHLEKML